MNTKTRYFGKKIKIFSLALVLVCSILAVQTQVFASSASQTEAVKTKKIVKPIVKTKTKNKYGAEISINNYDKYISNLPVDRRNSLNSTLYNMTKRNLKSGKLNIKDATIRKNSVKYKYNKKTDIHSGSFIVDMKSIKQSYLMSYEWCSDMNHNSNLSGYSAIAECLPSSKLVYGSFRCEDDFANSPNKTKRNPILDYLPYSTFNYTITGNYNKNNKLDLDVNMILYSFNTRNGERNNSIKKYKADVVKWIKSKKLNPNDYLINYIIHE